MTVESVQQVQGNRATYFRSTKAKKEDYQAILQGKIEELSEKIKNGDTETSYQIGAQSFTQTEWNKLIEEFDEAEENVRKLMREEQERKEEEELQEKAQEKKIELMRRRLWNS